MKIKLAGKSLLLLAAAVMLCTACSDTKPEESKPQTSATTSITTSATQTTTTTSATATALTTVTTTAKTTTTPAPVELEEPTVESGEVTVEAETVETAEPIETVEPVVTTASTTTAATTPAATTAPPKPAAPVVVPTIKAATSPMTNAQIEEDAVVDYSNISQGYISAKYNGSSARAKMRIICGDVVSDHDLNADGIFEYYPLTEGSGDYNIQLYEQLDGKMYSEVINITVTANISDEVSPYIYPNRYVMYEQGSDCVYKAAEVCAGITDTIERIAAIFGYITDNITYDYDLADRVSSGSVGVYVPDPDSVLARKKGICYDYASLFAAMLRSQGIPSRLVIGYAKENIYHAWNEVYTTETGWISTELLLKQKGYNIVDSTFYANTPDKPRIAAYIMDSGNYSAIYRY